METPPARGRDAAMLQRQLDAASGHHMHRRRVSRNRHLEDSFFTPLSSPQGNSTSQTRFGSTISPQEQGDAIYTPGNRLNFGTESQNAMNCTFTAQEDALNMSNNSAETIDNAGVGNNRATKDPLNNMVGVPRPSHVERSLYPEGHSHGRTPSGSSHHSPARALGSRRRCAKCDGDISGHFVRALGAAFHIACFTCEDCGIPCAAKFFPVDGKPLCEHCYFKRQNLLCYRCGKSLRGSYITALERKYHVEHFTCSMCTTVFGPDDSYFEYNGDVYCRAHYSSLFAFHCEGCKSPILKQFVETYRGGKKQQWHPECYMIFKFWNVKITDPKAQDIDSLRQAIASTSDPTKPLDQRASQVIAHEEGIDKLTMKTWTTLCGFEEACAAEISEFVQQAVNGDFKAAYVSCSRLVALIRVLFTAIDATQRPTNNSRELTTNGDEPRESGREAKTLCRKIVSAMSLLSKTRDLSTNERLQGLAKELLALASAIAHYLKVLIRQGLSTALAANIVEEFLDYVDQYSRATPAKTVSPFSTDQCVACGKAVEDKCYRQRGRHDRLWHARSSCFKCTKTGATLDPATATLDSEGKLISKTIAGPNNAVSEFVSISKLEQYIILLHVALARLDLVLSNTRKSQSKESLPAQTNYQTGSTGSVSGQYEGENNSNTTLRSATFPGSAPAVLKRTSTILHEKAGLTLDDIRRIVAAEQAKIVNVDSQLTDRKGQPAYNQQQQQQQKLPQQSQQQQQQQQHQPSQQLPQSKYSHPLYRKSSLRYFGTLNEDEYNWTRQIAQALLQPYSQKYLKRDLDSVVSSVKTPTLWGRMGKVFTKEQDGRVFGQPLERVVNKYGVDSALVTLYSDDADGSPNYTLRIPSLVEDCIMAMRQKDMSVEGIFRKNGNIRRLREFADKIDRNPDENGLLADESPIQLAALLKKFLRDLPDPLLCSRLSSLWSLVPCMDDETERVRLAQLLISVLPKANRNLLEILANFLNWVSSFAHVDDESGSKMDIQNLSTVLGPTLILSNEEAETAGGVSGGHPSTNGNVDTSTPFRNVSEPVKFLISHSRVIAQVPDDINCCLTQLKGCAPRKLSTAEAQDLLSKSSTSRPSNS